MDEFKRHRKTTEQELRPVTEDDIRSYHHSQADNCPENLRWDLSVSHSDRENGSPKIGDWIARNPKSPYDQWLVNEEFYRENYEPVVESGVGLIGHYGPSTDPETQKNCELANILIDECNQNVGRFKNTEDALVYQEIMQEKIQKIFQGKALHDLLRPDTDKFVEAAEQVREEFVVMARRMMLETDFKVRTETLLIMYDQMIEELKKHRKNGKSKS